jgi:peptide/nickel transport system substrate-binding protein
MNLIQLVGLLAFAACTPSPPATPTPEPGAAPFSGGTLRIVMPAHNEGEGFGRFGESPADTGGLDPHRDWPGPYDTWELFRCCLARNLLSTNGRPVDQGGSHLHPDIASGPPEIAADGLTWTFRLKPGLRYSPPLQDVEISAHDFIRSFHRLMDPQWANEYWPGLFEDVVGAAEYRSGAASSISGLSSPDPHTLVIRLTEPAGDLAPRLATSGLIPVPPSPRDPGAPFGIADGHDDDFGRFLVSSGPYMIEGSEALDLTAPPEDQTALAGLVPGQRLALVPNPSWDPTTDALRAALPGRIELQVVASPEAGIERINAAAADLYVNSPLSEQVASRVRGDPRLGRIFINEAGNLRGIMMKTVSPPFDDIHVRRAVNHVINKAAALDILGGALQLRIAHHIAPDSMEDNLLIDYRPFAGAAGTGDLEAAKAEIRQSKYDGNQDGLCDADACRNVAVAIGGDQIAEPVSHDLESIGITLGEVSDDPQTAVTDPADKTALFIWGGWGRDYLSASNFFIGQFYGPVALADGGNVSLIGASPEQLADWGYEIDQAPNVDRRIEACVPLTGAAQFECWASLDQYMMENVAAFVPIGEGVTPILGSRRVTAYSWDEIATAPAYDRIGLSGEVPVEVDSSTSPSVTASSIATNGTDSALDGLWESERVTSDSIVRALAAASLDPGGADMIVDNEGFEDYIVYQVEIRDGRLRIYAFPDGRTTGVGWDGTYVVDGDGHITATDPFLDCVLSYEYEVSGDQLTVDLIDDPCPDNDEFFQTVIFESGPFSRAE